MRDRADEIVAGIVVPPYGGPDDEATRCRDELRRLYKAALEEATVVDGEIRRLIVHPHDLKTWMRYVDGLVALKDARVMENRVVRSSIPIYFPTYFSNAAVADVLRFARAAWDEFRRACKAAVERRLRTIGPRAGTKVATLLAFWRQRPGREIRTLDAVRVYCGGRVPTYRNSVNQTMGRILKTYGESVSRGVWRLRADVGKGETG